MSIQASFSEVPRIIRDAGELAMRYHQPDVVVEFKDSDPNNPVTRADREVDELLKRKLPTLAPGSAWLSEETADNTDRLDADHLWVVDSIDGTKDFVEQTGNWCIMIAYVARRGGGFTVEYSAVFAPVRNELFEARLGFGARMNGEIIHVGNQRRPSHAHVLVSPSDTRKGKLNKLSCMRRTEMGSTGLRMCNVACGRYSASLKVGEIHQWDVAAPLLIVEEAGGVTQDLRGRLFKPNQRELAIDGQVSACTDELADALTGQFA